MKFPTLPRKKPIASLSIEKDTLGPAIAPSSQQTSIAQAEKETSLSSTSSRQNSQHERGPRIVETSPSDEVQASETLSDEPKYPSGWKLGIIMTSLALSVFLMALVSPTLSLYHFGICTRYSLTIPHMGSVSTTKPVTMLILIQDNTIIATAIPKITDHFKALDDVGWYGAGTLARILC